jgi:hypothetical protein
LKLEDEQMNIPEKERKKFLLKASNKSKVPWYKPKNENEN